MPPTWYLFLELIIYFVKFSWHSDKDNLIRHLSNHTCILTATAGGGFFKTKPFTYYFGQNVFPERFHIVCMYVYITFLFSRVHMPWCFPFEDFHVVWEYSYLEKLPVLWRCSFEKNVHFTLMVHFEESDNLWDYSELKIFSSPRGHFPEIKGHTCR